MKRRQALPPEAIARLLEKLTLTYPETAAVLAVGVSNLRGAIARHEIDLTPIEIGARRVFATAAVKRLLGIEDGTAT